jgi:hypothetical protein
MEEYFDEHSSYKNNREKFIADYEKMDKDYETFTTDDIYKFVKFITIGGLSKSIYSQWCYSIGELLSRMFEKCNDIKNFDVKHLDKLFLLINKKTKKWQFLYLKIEDTGVEELDTHNKWIDILLENQILLTEQHINILYDAGYSITYNIFEKYKNINSKLIDTFFKNRFSCNKFMKSPKKYKLLLQKNKYILTKQNLIDAISTAYKEGQSDTCINLLKAFDICEYKFDFMDLINTLALEYDMSNSAYGDDKKIIIKMIDDILLFFNNKNIILNFDTILGMLEINVINGYSSFTNCHTYIFDTFYFENKSTIDNITVDENQLIRLLQMTTCNMCTENSIFLGHSNHDYVCTMMKRCLEVFKISITQKTAEFAIKVNNVYMIQYMLNNNSIQKANTNVGLKYACLNNNEELIKYYLNQKIVPTNDHLYYITLSNISHESLETLTELFIECGFSPNDFTYEIFLLLRLTKNNRIYNWIVNMISLQVRLQIEKKINMVQSVDFGIPEDYYYGNDDEIKDIKDMLYELTNINTLQHLCKSRDLSAVLSFVTVHKVELDYQCMNNTVFQFQGNLALLEYVHDEYNFVPSIFSLLLQPNFYRRYTMLRHFYPNVINDLFCTTKNNMLDDNVINITSVKIKKKKLYKIKK